MSEIIFTEDAFCEHCGHLELYSPVFDEDYVQWCMDCAESNNMVTQEEAKEAREKSIHYQVEFYSKRIELLKSYL